MLLYLICAAHYDASFEINAANDSTKVMELACQTV